MNLRCMQDTGPEIWPSAGQKCAILYQMEDASRFRRAEHALNTNKTDIQGAYKQ